MAKVRLDQLVVERGLAPSREKAKALILAGQVLLDGQKSDKAGREVSELARVELLAQPRFVSRGGLKLEAALEHWGIDVTGKVGLDVGSSTGGFTDCLLQRGARIVYAFDVGSNQMDWKLRSDPRVVLREGVNARFLQPSDIAEPADILVADVSFISITLILPAAVALLRPHGELAILVKPQFEVGRGQVGKGGIVREPALHEEAVAKVSHAVQALGFGTEVIDSPILGAEGNKEFLLYGRRH
ncbi:MAG: TlyA family RNA methyltransferase [Hyphomonas sp.]|jgi:23S rRNA (cytidine1920-2'-O)/16S rRNA (cytidine1409-2'-O)-methyltransferase|nr:TlyA family RNA methyltransferase [Hyphomonas sp.]